DQPPQRRVTVRDVSDVIHQPPDLVDENQSPDRLALGAGNVHVKGVGSVQGDGLAHARHPSAASDLIECGAGPCARSAWWNEAWPTHPPSRSSSKAART